MKVYSDVESVNLSTSERRRRVCGDGESRLEPVGVVERRLGPSAGPTEEEWAEGLAEISRQVQETQFRKQIMHYRNGREAKNGDVAVQIGGSGQIIGVGVLHSATPGNDYCNGNLAGVHAGNQNACLVDCLHMDDVAELIKAAGLSQRPPGK